MKQPQDSLSPKLGRNKKRDFHHPSARKKIVVTAGAFIGIALAVFGILKINSFFMVAVPAAGGELTEGGVGIPRFINPVLAISDTDRDLAELVYAGLLKHTTSGGYAPELAESYQVSEDGLSYTVVLKKGLTWHDETPVTADDVIFTVHKIQDDLLRSPLRPDWEGVNVWKKDMRTVLFTLDKPYGPFLENLTVGILPKHLWENQTPKEFLFSTWNTDPVGSGPYRLTSTEYREDGTPEFYTLQSFSDYALGKPFIEKIHFRFFENQKMLIEALRNGTVESIAGIGQNEAKKLKEDGFRIETAPLLRVFAVFFNQNKNDNFADDAVREALALSVDKQAIVEKALLGYGFPIDGPLPIPMQETGTSTETAHEEAITEAKTILENAGWTYNEETTVFEKGSGNEKETLSFTLTTLDASDFRTIAEILKKNWETMGARVTLEFLPADSLGQEIIRPREYEALFFGQVIGHNPDLYAFWHSSQRLDPGLNVGLFTEINADEILEEARTLSDTSKRNEEYQAFQVILEKEKPAIFLYTPNFIYVVPEKLKGVRLGPVAVASDRFFNISEWFIETENVWKFFLKDDKQTGESETTH